MARNRRDDVLDLLTVFEGEISKTQSLAALAQKLVGDLRMVLAEATTDAQIKNIKDELAEAEDERDELAQKLGVLEKFGVQIVELDVLETLIDTEPDATLRNRLKNLIETVRAYPTPLQRHELLLRT